MGGPPNSERIDLQDRNREAKGEHDKGASTGPLREGASAAMQPTQRPRAEEHTCWWGLLLCEELPIFHAAL